MRPVEFTRLFTRGGFAFRPGLITGLITVLVTGLICGPFTRANALIESAGNGYVHFQTYAVRPARVPETISAATADALTETVKRAVLSQTRVRLTTTAEARNTLTPRLLPLGRDWALIIEKMRGGETVFVAQTPVGNLHDLVETAEQLTPLAMAEENSRQAGRALSNTELTPKFPYAQIIPSPNEALDDDGAANLNADGSASVPRTARDLLTPVHHSRGFWFAGLGAFASSGLHAERLLASFAAGHAFTLTPKWKLALLGEASFDSTENDARFLNLSTGPRYMFHGWRPNVHPHAGLDLGAGTSRDEEDHIHTGIAFGGDLGCDFLPTPETALDLSLRLLILGATDQHLGTPPALLGLRASIAF